MAMRQLKITKSITNREAESLEKYLQEIWKIDLITPEEEVQLAIRIHQGDERALEKLTKANLRFVVSVAKQYQNQWLSLSDLINEWNLGLIKAGQRFDETRGFKFISYAVWRIRQSILQALAEQSRIVRLPLNKIGLSNRISKAYSQLQQEYERDPSTEELAELLDMELEEVETTLWVAARHISVDAPFKDDEDGTLLDILENPNSDSADAELHGKESLKNEIARVLSTLTDRQRDVVKLYFGIGCESIGLEDIGERFNLTRERARQIKDKAITKMRKASVFALLNEDISQDLKKIKAIVNPRAKEPKPKPAPAQNNGRQPENERKIWKGEKSKKIITVSTLSAKDMERLINNELPLTDREKEDAKHCFLAANLVIQDEIDANNNATANRIKDVLDKVQRMLEDRYIDATPFDYPGIHDVTYHYTKQIDADAMQNITGQQDPSPKRVEESDDNKWEPDKNKEGKKKEEKKEKRIPAPKQDSDELRKIRKEAWMKSYLENADGLPSKYIDESDIVDVVPPSKHLLGFKTRRLNEQRFGTGIVALMQNVLKEDPSVRRFVCNINALKKISDISINNESWFVDMFYTRKGKHTKEEPLGYLIHIDHLNLYKSAALFEWTISDSMAKKITDLELNPTEKPHAKTPFEFYKEKIDESDLPPLAKKFALDLYIEASAQKRKRLYYKDTIDKLSERIWKVIEQRFEPIRGEEPLKTALAWDIIIQAGKTNIAKEQIRNYLIWVLTIGKWKKFERFDKQDSIKEENILHNLIYKEIFFQDVLSRASETPAYIIEDEYIENSGACSALPLAAGQSYAHLNHGKVMGGITTLIQYGLDQNPSHRRFVFTANTLRRVSLIDSKCTDKALISICNYLGAKSVRISLDKEKEFAETVRVYTDTLSPTIFDFTVSDDVANAIYNIDLFWDGRIPSDNRPFKEEISEEAEQPSSTNEELATQADAAEKDISSSEVAAISLSSQSISDAIESLEEYTEAQIGLLKHLFIEEDKELQDLMSNIHFANSMFELGEEAKKHLKQKWVDAIMLCEKEPIIEIDELFPEERGRRKNLLRSMNLDTGLMQIASHFLIERNNEVESLLRQHKIFDAHKTRAISLIKFIRLVYQEDRAILAEETNQLS